MEYVKHKRIMLKSNPAFNEKWLCQRIADEPTLLGLGEVDVKEVERVQPRAGRLDMLLFDPETTTRYEVELQLGATDESHIVRTIEYWDNERRRWPQYEHVAVIVAEEITARFFNVISLFNGFIPLVAIQLNAIEVNDSIALVFTTVLDRTTLGVEEDEEPDEPRDRSYWETKTSKAMLQVTDGLLTLVREVAPNIGLKYNKYYIGLSQGGVVTNFVSFHPCRQHVIANFKLPRSEATTQILADAGMNVLAHNAQSGIYRAQIDKDDLVEHADVLRELIKQAHPAYGLG